MARSGKEGVYAVRWGNRLRLIKGTLRQVEGYILSDYSVEPATVEDGIEAQRADIEIEDATMSPDSRAFDAAMFGGSGKE